MRWQQYPEYKDSDIKWLGGIPAHWIVAPVYARYQVQLGKMLDQKQITGEHLGPYLRNIDVQWNRINTIDLPQMDFPPSSKARFALWPGDLIVCEGGEVGRAAIWRGELDECYYQKALHRLRPYKPSDNPRFFYYTMWNAAKLGVFVAGGNPNTIDHLTADKLRKYRFAFPPFKEQRTIAAFLDRKTTHIDTLIAKKERQIELLQEKRAALISHAVTKGLDPNAPMQDSGVEWLGEVPVHWEVAPLKHLKAKAEHAFVDGPFGSNLKSIHFVDDGEMFVIESSFATSGTLIVKELKTITKEHFETVKRSETKCGDIIIAKIGARFGLCCILPDLGKRAVVSGNSMKLTVNTKHCDVRYIRYVLLHLKAAGAMSLLVNITAQPALSLGGMNTLKLPVPPVKEQHTIGDFIDKALDHLDILETHIHESMAKLREYRSALISAAVTGKIDLRYVEKQEVSK